MIPGPAPSPPPAVTSTTSPATTPAPHGGDHRVLGGKAGPGWAERSEPRDGRASTTSAARREALQQPYDDVVATLGQPRPPHAPALSRMRTARRLDEVDEHLVVHPALVHAAAIRADAEAQLAALHGWPQPVRCRSGVHVGGPGCYQHADPTTGRDHLPVQTEVGLHPLPFEVWAAQRPLQAVAVPLED